MVVCLDKTKFCRKRSIRSRLDYFSSQLYSTRSWLYHISDHWQPLTDNTDLALLSLMWCLRHTTWHRTAVRDKKKRNQTNTLGNKRTQYFLPSHLAYSNVVVWEQSKKEKKHCIDRFQPWRIARICPYIHYQPNSFTASLIVKRWTRFYFQCAVFVNDWIRSSMATLDIK